jgi:hypothetical protein
MYDFDTNSIIGKPIKSRDADQLVFGYQQCYDALREGNVTPILHQLDNEVNRIPVMAPILAPTFGVLF